MEKKPRKVRNFWIAISIDGRKSMVQCGPENVDGGFQMLIFQRVNGKPEVAFEITGTYDKVLEGMENLSLEIKRKTSYYPRGRNSLTSVTRR